MIIYIKLTFESLFSYVIDLCPTSPRFYDHCIPAKNSLNVEKHRMVFIWSVVPIDSYMQNFQIFGVVVFLILKSALGIILCNGPVEKGI